ncbi:DUF4382 domain-containing protein [Desulfoluna sp.]|uniref:DUF4382 domain-containing protein n=1 Tax=Desulfoluna sp. TaxID=2045199 RepID=UPI00260435A5|nr:DUF4382 domain-containing protein [Desulfoluna sp.]
MTRRFISILAALALLAVAGCNSSSSSSSSGAGDLNVSLTDAPASAYKAVYISVNQVEVKQSSNDDDNGWQVVEIVNETINLLDLSGGILKDLGTRNLPAATYNQLRLRLAIAPDAEKNILGTDHPFANYVIDSNDDVHELKVPSGYQSGIKLVKQFTIEAAGLTKLIIDFNAMKSVVEAGSSGKWLLKPVIQVIDTVTLAGVQGSVTDTPGSDQQGALVTAQTYSAAATLPEDEITVHAGTLTDNRGSYLLRVPAGEETLVVFKEGFLPACQRISTVTGTTLTEDFTLTAATSGTLSVTITGLTAIDDSVTISVRKSGLCGGSLSTLYEMTAQSFAADGIYLIALPPGTYSIVASGENLTTVTYVRTLTSNATETISVSL